MLVADSPLTGGCACTGVRYRIDALPRSVTNCHCEPCRRITGHFMAATAAPASAVHFDSDSTLTWYDSTPTVQYGFCSGCGATLFWRATDKPDHLSITAGSLDTPTGLGTNLALYTDDASDYHNLDISFENVGGDRQLGVSDD